MKWFNKANQFKPIAFLATGTVGVLAMLHYILPSFGSVAKPQYVPTSVKDIFGESLKKEALILDKNKFDEDELNSKLLTLGREPFVNQTDDLFDLQAHVVDELTGSYVLKSGEVYQFITDATIDGILTGKQLISDASGRNPKKNQNNTFQVNPSSILSAPTVLADNHSEISNDEPTILSSDSPSIPPKTIEPAALIVEVEEPKIEEIWVPVIEVVEEPTISEEQPIIPTEEFKKDKDEFKQQKKWIPVEELQKEHENNDKKGKTNDTSKSPADENQVKIPNDPAVNEKVNPIEDPMTGKEKQEVLPPINDPVIEKERSGEKQTDEGNKKSSSDNSTEVEPAPKKDPVIIKVEDQPVKVEVTPDKPVEVILSDKEESHEIIISDAPETPSTEVVVTDTPGAVESDSTVIVVEDNQPPVYDIR